MATTAPAHATTIRLATEADLPRLVEMAVRFLATTAYGALAAPTPKALGVLVAQVLHLGAIFVADVDGELQGMLALFLAPHPLSGAPYADELAWWVEPEHRGGSIGPRLLLRAETWAREQGATLLKMVAPAHSHVGAFYEQCGYVEVETAYQKPLKGWGA